MHTEAAENAARKCDNYYHPEADGGISIQDGSLGIDWQVDPAKAILSEKDLKHSEIAHGGGVEDFGEVGVILSLVDVGVGGTVDDDVYIVVCAISPRRSKLTAAHSSTSPPTTSSAQSLTMYRVARTRKAHRQVSTA